MQINFAPCIKEKSFFLNGGVNELLSFAEEFLRPEKKPCPLVKHEGYVFSWSKGLETWVYTSLDMLEEIAPNIEKVRAIDIELLTKPKKGIVTSGFNITSQNICISRLAEIQEYIPLFLSTEFSGWVSGDRRKENWDTIVKGKGTFQSKILRGNSVINFDCYIQPRKAGPATIRFSTRK